MLLNTSNQLSPGNRAKQNHMHRVVHQWQPVELLGLPEHVPQVPEGHSVPDEFDVADHEVLHEHAVGPGGGLREMWFREAVMG